MLLKKKQDGFFVLGFIYINFTFYVLSRSKFMRLIMVDSCYNRNSYISVAENVELNVLQIKWIVKSSLKKVLQYWNLQLLGDRGVGGKGLVPIIPFLKFVILSFNV